MPFLTKNKKRLLLVDISNIMFKGMSVHQNLTDSDGNFTGGIYGFMSQVASAIRELEISRVICCADRKPYYRAEGLEDPGSYKADRERSPESQERLEATEGPVNEFCRMLGMAEHVGAEADDLIAYLALRNKHRFDEIYVLTSDTDGYQLFGTPGLDLFFYKGSKQGVYGIKQFYQDTGFGSGHEWLIAEAIQGGHNGLGKGIVGYGPKKAKALVKKHHPYAEEAISGNFPEVRFNLAAMALPHPGVVENSHQFRETMKPQPIPRQELIKFCVMHDIKPTGNMIEAFTTVNK